MLGDFLRRRRYGEPIVIVSGLPRSGTSMMMKMLEAGGVPIMTDAIRTADVDNPKGYYEYERVKELEKETDKRYVREGRGKALKVISFLLKELPDDNFYRVVFMRRDLGEVISSQNKMLDRRGWSQVLPDPDEPVVHIYAEGRTRETSNELADELRALVEEVVAGSGSELEGRVSS